jgi:putative DNA primase/helicase
LHLSTLWPTILVASGIDAHILDGKQHPCPICGGKDRFRFDDKGEGLWYCNHCKSGDGFTLLCAINQITFKKAKAITDQFIGQSPVVRTKQPLSDSKKRELMNKAWSGAAPEALGLRDYLSKRGIMECLQFNPSIRWHPGLKCSSKDVVAPAVLIKCYRWGIDGKPEPATIQRHWPTLGQKMMMPAPIKLDGIFCPLGGRPVKGQLGVCEGYITALSCMALQPVPGMMPVWPTMSAEQLMKFVPPPEVRKLYIYIDVDKSFTGQAAGYALAKHLRITHPNLETVVCYPTLRQNVDYDYNDLLMGVDEWPTVSRVNHSLVGVATTDANHASDSIIIPMQQSSEQKMKMETKSTCDASVSSAEKRFIESTSSGIASENMQEKPADAVTTVSPIGGDHSTVSTPTS